MAFELYRLEHGGYVRTEFRDLDDKPFWCRLGNKKEKAFVKFSKKHPFGHTVAIHPAKTANPYHPDLLVDGRDIGEVKTKNSPLFLGWSHGVDPQFALTMDLKDSFNYCRWLARGVDLQIFAWVKWEVHRMIRDGRTYDVKPMAGVWLARFSDLRKKETSANPPAIHWYREKFRRPTEHCGDGWAAELIRFEPRLQIGNRSGAPVARNVSSDGFLEADGVRHPAGQSSGSYVFDLSDTGLFQKLDVARPKSWKTRLSDLLRRFRQQPRQQA